MKVYRKRYWLSLSFLLTLSLASFSESSYDQLKTPSHSQWVYHKAEKKTCYYKFISPKVIVKFSAYLNFERQLILRHKSEDQKVTFNYYQKRFNVLKSNLAISTLIDLQQYASLPPA